jgi:hypothetical protein
MNAPSNNSGDWIEWFGGDCPVDRSSFVEVKFRDGDDRTGPRAREARNYIWSHGWRHEDIIAYRVVSQ